MFPAWKDLWDGKHHRKVTVSGTANPQSQPLHRTELLLLSSLLCYFLAFCSQLWLPALAVLSLAKKWDMSRSVRPEECLVALVDSPGVELSSLALHQKYFALSCVLGKLKLQCLQLLGLCLLTQGPGRKCDSTFKNSYSMLFRNLTVLLGRCIRQNLV